MERILALALIESLHKRRSYLQGQRIVTLSDYIRRQEQSAPAVTNAARRQTIPAFGKRACGRLAIQGSSHEPARSIRDTEDDETRHTGIG